MINVDSIVITRYIFTAFKKSSWEFYLYDLVSYN